MKKLLVVFIIALFAFQGYTQTTIVWKGITWEVMYGSASVDGNDHLVLTADGTGQAWVHVNQIANLAGASTPWLQLSYVDTGNPDHDIDMLMEDEDGLNYPRFAVGSLFSGGQIMMLRHLSNPTHETYLYWDGPRANTSHTVYVGKRATGTLDVNFDGTKRSSTYLNQFSGGTWEFGDVYLRIRNATSGTTVTFTDFSYGINHANQNPTAFIVTHDDQGAYMNIQKSIDESYAGDVVAITAGTYTEDPISLNKAVTVQGPNVGLAGTSTRAAESRIQNTKITITDAATIDGVEIYQTNDVQDAVLVQAAATIKNSVIKRFGTTTGNSVRGITTAVGTSGFSIQNNLFTGDPGGGFFGGHKTWNSGVYLNGGSGAITGNTFENCRTAINSDDFNAGITISGNTFKTSGTYIAFGGVTPTDGQYTISGNEFFFDWANPVTNWLPDAFINNSNVAPTFRMNVTGNTFGGAPTTALTLDQKYRIEGRMYHRGRGNKTGVVDFVTGEQIVVSGTTIQSAINAAGAGNVVYVAPGTYAESVSVTKSLTIRGAKWGIDARTRVVSSGESILDGASLNHSTQHEAFDIATGVSDVVIDGFEMKNYYYQTYPSSTNGWGNAIFSFCEGTDAGANSVTIQNNYMHDLGYNGVIVGSENAIGSSMAIQSNWLIQKNRIENTSYAAVELTNVTNSQVLDNNIAVGSTIFADPGDAGVGIEVAARSREKGAAAGTITISGNVITGSFPVGSRAAINILSRAYLAAGSSNASLTELTISNNTITGATNVRAAILMVGETRNTGPADVSNVTVSGNTLDGNYCGVEIQDYNKGGLTAPTHSNINLNQNELKNSTANGLHVMTSTNATGITLTNNKFILNAIFAAKNEGTGTLNAEHNYWGSTDAANVLAAINGNVDADPWCNADFSVCNYTFPFTNTNTGEGYLSLGAAIQDAADGQHIDINNPGNSNGITVNKPAGHHIFIDNNSNGTFTINGGSPALTVTSGTVTTTNLTYTTATDDPTILVNGGNLIIRNCTINSSTAFDNAGIMVTSGTLDAGTNLSDQKGNNTFVYNSSGDKAIDNQTETIASAIGNYWGNVIYPAIIVRLSGPVGFDPWCNSAFDDCTYSLSTPGPITYAPKLIRPASTITVPITVDNFSNVMGVTLKLAYGSQLTYSGFDLGVGVPSGWSIDNANGNLFISFQGSTGFNLANGAVLLNLTFNYDGTAPASLTWNETGGGTDLEYTNAKTQGPFYDTPNKPNYYKDGYVTNGSLTFTREYPGFAPVTGATAQHIIAHATGGTGSYTYSWTGPAGFTADGNVLTPGPIPDSYGDYSVTATDGSGATITGSYHYDRVHNIDPAFMLDYHDIQAAITAASSGNTLVADEGTYTEDIIVTKPLKLYGSNYNHDPNAGWIHGESILYPLTNNASTGVLMELSVSGIEVKGFAFDGNKPGADVGTPVNTIDVNTSIGIENGSIGGDNNGGLHNVDNIIIINNKFRNFTYQGIYIQNTLGTSWSGNYLNNNNFDNMKEGIQTYALHAYIDNNKMTHVLRGLSTHGMNTAATGEGFTPEIAHNNITISWTYTPGGATRAVGIWNNYQRDNASALSVHDNTITFPEATPAGSTAIGMYALSMDNNRIANYNNNEVIGNGNCNVGFYASGTTSPNVKISGGLLGNIKDDGVRLVNWDAVWGGQINDNARITVDNVLITMVSAGNGVKVYGDPAHSTAFAIGTVQNDCGISGGAAGIMADGASASVIVNENDASITGNTVGIDITNSGTATITENTITGNEIGIRIRSTGNLSSATNNFITLNSNAGIQVLSGAGTIGAINNNDLSGNTTWAIDNLSGPIADATCNWYGTNTVTGVAAEVNGLVTYDPWLAIGTDNDNPGFVPLPNTCYGMKDLYVNDDETIGDSYTPVIGVDAYGRGSQPLPYATITYAVDKAMVGSNIYVDAGEYQEQISIGKSLNMTGVDTIKTIVKAPTTMTSVSNGLNAVNTPIIYAYGNANTINISKMVVDGAEGRNVTRFFGIFYYEANGVVNNCVIKGIRMPVFDGSNNWAFWGGHTRGVSIPQNITVSNCNIRDYGKAGIVIDAELTHATITGNRIIGQKIPGQLAQNGIQVSRGANATITGNHS